MSAVSLSTKYLSSLYSKSAGTSVSVRSLISTKIFFIERIKPFSVSHFFSTTGGKEGSDDTNKSSPNDDDPFGVNYIDTDHDGSREEAAVINVGPKIDLPPNYIRDAATGKFTGKIHKEISREESDLLKLSPLAKNRFLTNKFSERVGKDELELASRRIREQEVAFNTLGRKVSDVKDAMASEGTDGYSVESSHSASLSKNEFNSLGRFMRNSVANDDERKSVNNLLRDAVQSEVIPIARKSSTRDSTSEATKDENNPDLDLEWTSLTAQRSMLDIDDEDLDDPLANLMPSDLNPAKKVNRKRAKLLPKELLHHNNLALLRRYVTPGGQIMNRVQSRLGAKDQRKIAKLVKRARHLGIIPVLGQWKVEDHGNLKENDLFENREWEEELINRGLIDPKSIVYGKNSNNNGTSGMW